MSYINTDTGVYPVSEQEIRSLFPETGFPVPFDPPVPYVWVFPAPVPAYDPIRQYVVEIAPALVTLGHYEQRYKVKALPDDVIAANVAGQKTTLTKQFETAVQSVLDTSAQAAGYDNISTAVSYAEEPIVVKFQNDGLRFRVWRSLVWAYAYDQLTLVLAGQLEVPTQEAFLAELPVLGAAV